MKKAAAPPLAYCLTLAPIGGARWPPAQVRLRRLLKVSYRSYGLRTVAVSGVARPEARKHPERPPGTGTDLSNGNTTRPSEAA